MKSVVLPLSVVLFGFLAQESGAQSFYYVPPGYDFGYTYGLNVGNGVGYGYGAAVGVPLTMQQLGSSYTPPVQQPQTWTGYSGSYEQSKFPTAVPKKSAKLRAAKKMLAVNGKMVRGKRLVTVPAFRKRR